MKKNKATANIQIDNKLVKVTKYSFMPGQETGTHKHLYDYIVTPITDGKILLIDENGNKSDYSLTASHSYFRKAGIEHNVINNGEQKLIFVETEIKNIK
jgi:quercetin dioxygenase-like cupin family protein